MNYASASSRFWANVVDRIILFALWLPMDIFLQCLGPSFSSTPELSFLFGMLNFFFVLFYFVYLETSSTQATPGMEFMGICICTKNSKRLSRLRSIGRYLLYLCGPSVTIYYREAPPYVALILTLFSTFMAFFLPLLPIFFTKKKQTLYDMLTDVVVVKAKQEQTAGVVAE